MRPGHRASGTIPAVRSPRAGLPGRALGLVALVALALFADAAHAAPQTFVALEYEVASDAIGCPDVEEFRASVARQLHYDPFRPTADRRVVVQITAKEAGFGGQIRWTDADGQSKGDRRLSSRRSDCGEIAASLAFAVVVQIQLLTTLAPPAPAAAAPSPPAPAPAPPPPPPGASATPVPPPNPPAAPPPEDAPAPARRMTWSVGIGPALALALAPQPTGLARIFVAGRLTRLSLEIAFDAAWPAAHEQIDGSGFSLDRFGGGAAACGHARALAACATATLGMLRARGSGVDAPAAASGLYAQVGARIAASLDLGRRYFAVARVDGLVMLSPWTVTLNQIAAWTTPRVGAVIGADFGARFF